MDFKIKKNMFNNTYYKYLAYIVLFIGLISITTIFINIDKSNNKKNPSAEKGSLDISEWDFEKSGVLKLNGEWEFYYGQLLDYDDFHKDTQKADFTGYIKVPGKWRGYKVNGKAIGGRGYGTYRLKVNMNNKEKDITKGIILPYSLTAYKLMVDNDIICTNGKVGIDKNSSTAIFARRVIPFQPNSENFEIIIQVSNYSFNGGGTYQPLYMGNYTDIAAADKKSSLKDMFLFACLMIMGMYHIVVYIFLPKKRYTLHFGVFCVIVAIRTIITCETLLINNFIKIDFGTFMIANHVGIFLGIICVSNFFYELFQKEFSKNVFKILKIYSIGFTISMLIIPYEKFGKTFAVCNVILVIIAMYLLKVLFKAMINKREGASMMLAGMGILLVTVISDVWYVNSIKNSAFYGVTSLGIIIFIFILAVMISKIFSNAFLNEEKFSLKLRSLDRLKDEFLANTSHELRTPLNGIIGISDSLLEGAGGEISGVLKRNLAIISSSARRLSNLVNDILDYSKLKHKDIELDIKVLNLYEVVENVLIVFNLSNASKKLLIKNEVSENIPNIYADENRLQQIIYNLIGNAVKFTSEGEISIKAKEKEEFIEIVVEDTGIGIPKEKLNDIFKSFEQVDPSISRKHGGTGLGLSITQKLINLHGGEIYCESEVGKGTRFIFTLPLSKLNEQNSKNSKRLKSKVLFNQIEEKGIITLNENSSPGKFKILAVDDEMVNLQVLKNILSLHNYHVVTAFNGKDALNYIENEEFDLVILDVMMPNMSGYEVCRIIREKYSLVELPVLMLTAKSQIENLCRGFEYGANDYIIKPFEKEELLARIKTLITMKKAVNLSIMDSLTGIFNRRYLFELAEVVLNEYKKDNQHLSVIMMDIDSFKKINDTYGHAAGDKVLAEIALRCKEVLRTTDIFGRYGGEEFAAVLPKTTLHTAVEIAEDIRKNVSNKAVKIDNLYELQVTVSLGVAKIKSGDVEVHNIFDQADSALYIAKKSGRDRTVHI